MISDITKESIAEFLAQGKRFDDRDIDEFRDVTIETDVVDKAEGSAMVSLGDSRVIVGVKMSVGTPFPDTPDKGVLITNTELTPLSSDEFEPGPPGEDATEIARVVDRAIREAGIIDLEKLCIEEGEAVWMVFIDIYTLNANGNLFDAGALGAMAALMTAKMPKYEDERVNYEERDGPLPVKGKAVSATLAKIGETIIVDPTRKEEKALDARLTVGVNQDGNIVSLQKGGDGGLTDAELEEMLDRALKHSEKLLKALK